MYSRSTLVQSFPSSRCITNHEITFPSLGDIMKRLWIALPVMAATVAPPMANEIRLRRRPPTTEESRSTQAGC
jgi:hypothetical protein